MLLEFYGTECPHCAKMKPIVEKIEKEEGIKIEKKEVWHNEENAREMGLYDDGVCGGVPFYFNTDTGKYICGEADQEELRAWATGK